MISKLTIKTNNDAFNILKIIKSFMRFKKNVNKIKTLCDVILNRKKVHLKLKMSDENVDLFFDRPPSILSSIGDQDEVFVRSFNETPTVYPVEKLDKITDCEMLRRAMQGKNLLNIN